jgi:hypothetical protein
MIRIMGVYNLKIDIVINTILVLKKITSTMGVLNQKCTRDE